MATSEEAQENWRRITVLWAWLGRSEENEEILTKLARYAPGAPIDTLRRAMLGDARGGGRIRQSNARTIVGPLLGVDYGEDYKSKQPRRQLDAYHGPAGSELQAYLRSLNENVHIDLADGWVAFLRHGGKEPAPWRGADAGAAPVPTNVEDATKSGPGPTATEAGAGFGLEPKPVSDSPPAAPAPRRALVTVVIAAALVALAASQALLPKESREERPEKIIESKADVDAATERQPPPPSPPPAPPVDPVRITVEAERGGEPFAVHDRAELQHHDLLAFNVEADEPLYASVIVVHDDGRLTLLYPPPRSEMLLQPGRKHRIPHRREGAFELDDKPGEERMLVVATNEPVARDAAALKALIDPLTKLPEWPAGWPAPSAGARAAAKRPGKTRQAGPVRVHTRNVNYIAFAPRNRTGEPVVVAFQALSFFH